jgi:phage gp36-like protein
MGRYATVTSLALLLPGFAEGDTITVDEVAKNRFSKHIDRAESLVDAAIGRKYALPFISEGDTTTTNVPPAIRTLSEDIACYFAMRGSFSQDGKTKNPYLDDYERALETLEKIALGTMPLVYTGGSEVPANSSSLIMSSTKTFRPVFGLDDAVDWRRDPDEVRQTEAERQES